MRRLASSLGLALALVVAAAPATPASAMVWRGTAVNALGYGEPHNTEQLNAAQRAGANAVRMDITWSELQPIDKDHFDQTYVATLDAYLQKAADRGLKVIAVFQSTPTWAAAPAGTTCGSTPASSRPPSNAANYATAAAYVAQRWGARLAALEVWNEFNNPTFWCSTNWVADYATLLKAAYPAIKAANGTLPVLGGALLYSHADTLDELYDKGVKGSFDGLALHPYDDPNPPDATHTFAQGVPLVRQEMVSRGDGDKPIWLTELGWPTCPASVASRCVSQDQQAAKVTDAFRRAEGWWYVAALVVFSLRDATTGSTNWEYNMGLLHTDYTEKPSFAAFQRAAAPPPAPQPPPPTTATSAPAATAATPAPGGSTPAPRRHVAPLPTLRRWTLLRTRNLRVYLVCRARERCRGIVQIVRRRGRHTITLATVQVSLPAGRESVRTVRLSGALAARVIRLLVSR